MVSYVQQVQQDLSKFKSLGEGPESLADRQKVMTQIMIHLTAFDNIPPCEACDPKECILARKLRQQLLCGSQLDFIHSLFD